MRQYLFHLVTGFKLLGILLLHTVLIIAAFSGILWIGAQTWPVSGILVLVVAFLGIVHAIGKIYDEDVRQKIGREPGRAEK